jgi:hypothetical protein
LSLQQSIQLSKNPLRISRIRGRDSLESRRRILAAGNAGGADRDRTDDPLLAKQVLSQLSYSPVSLRARAPLAVVGLGRFELPTSRLSGVRSDQLSYRPSPGSDSLETESRMPTINLRCRALRNPRTAARGESFRKEVIQPQVLLQLPCYDFTPITDHTMGSCPPCGLAHRLPVQPAFVM